MSRIAFWTLRRWSQFIIHMMNTSSVMISDAMVTNVISSETVWLILSVGALVDPVRLFSSEESM